MKIVKKLTAAVAAVCLAATTSCSATIGKNSQNALTVDGVEIGSGMLVYQTISAYDKAVSMLSDQNSETPTVKDVKNSKIDEKDAVDWIQDKATEELLNYAAVIKKSEENGITLTDEEKEESKSIAEYIYAMDSRPQQNGVSVETFYKISDASYLQDKLFEHYFGLGSEMGCSEDELKDFFKENFARIKYFSISLTNSDGEAFSDDELRDINKKADEYVRKINKKSGELDKLWELDAANDEYKEYVQSLNTTTAAEGETVETTTTAAEETTTEAETTTTNPYANERLFQKQTTAADDSTSENTETSLSEENYQKFNDFIFNELKPGEAVKYQYDKDNLYIIMKADIEERMTEDDYWSEDYIKDLLQLRFYEKFQDYMKEYASSLDVKKNNSAYRRFEPFSLNLEKTSSY
ncbi:MAG: hypothetical protein J5501_10455 [Ruminococcus sp.]|nr:hypothetical protein [Ruminococcus sp.]